MPVPDDFGSLIQRLGETHVRQRVTLQVEHAREVFGRRATLFHIENVEWLMVFLYYLLKGTGLYGQGYRNFLDLRIVENTVRFRGLPAAFRGFRMLHLSDLHIDLDPGFSGALIERLKGLEYDVCVLTGDYRTNTSGDYEQALAEMTRLAAHLKPPVYAALGNHDFIEMAPPLERAGIRFLLNETVALSRGGASIYLSGVDDPHFYQTDNLQKARESIPAGALSILLAHSPEIHRRASACGYDFMLCGHTHAGQICLPGRIALLSNANCPRRYYAGAWRDREMQGYTSPGTGSCGVPVRFFCPPEITIHQFDVQE